MRSSTGASSSDTDGRIFQTMRQTFQWFGLIKVPLRYEIPAPANVEYEVTLYFPTKSSFWLWLFGGVATVDVLLQDKVVFGDLWLVEDGTAFKGLSVNTTITSTADGLIKIEVQGVNLEPLLSAIEIHAVDANTNVETPPATTPTAAPTCRPSAGSPTTPSTPKPNTPSATAAPISPSTIPTAAPVPSTIQPPTILQATPFPVAAPTLSPVDTPVTLPPAVDPTMQPVEQGTSLPVAVPQTTSSPVEAPTMSPVVDPTMQTIGQPTAAPVTVPQTTSSPIETPTMSPMVALVTSAPVVDPTMQPIETPTESYGTPRFEGGWEKSKNYPLYVAEAQGAMIGEDLCVFSGFNEPDGGYDAATTRNYALDTSDPNAQWRRLDDLPVSEGITHGGFVVVGTKFYMCGGYLGGHPGPHIPTCLVYDHSASSGNQWSSLPDLPDGRAGGGMVYDSNTNSLTFAGGAERPNANNAHAEDYTDTWTLELDNLGAGWKRKKDIPFLANHMSFVTARDGKGKEVHIFVAGQIGENEYTGNIKDNYRYDVANDQWIKLQDMILTRGHAASSTRAIGNGFLIAGGSTNENGKTASIHYYDVPSDTWTKIGDLPNPVNTPVCDISPDGYLYCESGWANWNYSFRRKIVVDKL